MFSFEFQSQSEALLKLSLSSTFIPSVPQNTRFANRDTSLPCGLLNAHHVSLGNEVPKHPKQDKLVASLLGTFRPLYPARYSPSLLTIHGQQSRLHGCLQSDFILLVDLSIQALSTNCMVRLL